MQTDEEFAAKANLYMSQDKEPTEAYNGETVVYHYLELLRDVVGFDKLKEACVELGFLTEEKFDEVFHPEQMV